MYADADYLGKITAQICLPVKGCLKLMGHVAKNTSYDRP